MSTRRSWKQVLVVGAGNFGTCLGQHLAEQGYDVILWARAPEVVSSINTTHKNPKYLSTITLSSRLSATNNVDKRLLDATAAVVLATPTQSLREVLGMLKPHLSADTLLVSAAKGIEISSLEFPNVIIKDALGSRFGDDAVFLSGPSFAEEIIRGQPTAVSIASKNPERCQWTQDMFHASHFRVYTSQDPAGLEVAGALKNVIAIASGACSGLGFQLNSRAALLTRGLAEIMRVGAAAGANPLTFLGLGGVGDLFLTSTSEKSRNFTVGFRLGRGEDLPHILATMGSVAEGVTTAKAAHALSRKLKVDTPIIDEVYCVLYEKKPIKQAVADLLSRDAKAELILPTFSSKSK